MRNAMMFIRRISALAVTLGLILTLIPATPVLAAPQVSISPTSGTRGTEVTVSGTNFASYIGDAMHIHFGGVEIATSPVTIPEDGILTATFPVPCETAPGTHYVSVIEERGIELARSNPFTVAPANVAIDPEAGTVGTQVTIHGEGFCTNDKVAFYCYNGERVKIGEVTASPTGEFAYSFTVSNSSGGSHQVAVQDAHGNEAETSFRVIPAIALEPASASVGSELVVSGTGFGSNSSATVYLGGVEAATERTDESGSFRAIFEVPELSSRISNLEVRDESGNTAQTQFATAPSISLSKTTGYIGEKVTIKGTGFPAGLSIIISYDDFTVAEGVTLENGTFSLSFNVPTSMHGNHEITASDGTNPMTTLFAVESVAPPTPKLILLENPDKVKPGAHFKWEDVSDPSSVTYIFQVATDAAFSSVIFKKTELALPEYVVTKEDELLSSEEIPYYWRVKAVDGASNESEWSTAQSFYYFYGWPRSRQYMVVAILWAVTGVICYRVGKSRRFS